MSTELKINFKSLNEIIVAEDATTPTIIRAVTPSVQQGQWSTQGPMNNPAKLNVYVRVEALPKELQERIKMAVEALSWG
jgi:hypothetical protein